MSNTTTNIIDKDTLAKSWKSYRNWQFLGFWENTDYEVWYDTTYKLYYLWFRLDGYGDCRVSITYEGLSDIAQEYDSTMW